MKSALSQDFQMQLQKSLHQKHPKSISATT